MTMVLTFVMMVLGVMIFILSQDQAAKALGNVARALKMESDQISEMAAPELQDAILKAINRGGDGRGAGGDSLKDEGGRLIEGKHVGIAGGAGPADQVGSGPFVPAQDSGSGPHAMGDGAIPGAKIAPVRDPLNKESQSPETPNMTDVSAAPAGGAGISKPGSTTGETQIETTFKGGLAGQKSAGLGGEFLVTDSKSERLGNRDGVGVRESLGTGAVRFVFERDAINLPADAGEALRAFVQSQGFAELNVEALAVPGQVGLTEARRKAYFRAMILRGALIKEGVRPGAIKVQVKDADQISVPETVDVVKKPGAP